MGCYATCFVGLGVLCEFRVTGRFGGSLNLLGCLYNCVHSILLAAIAFGVGRFMFAGVGVGIFNAALGGFCLW